MSDPKSTDPHGRTRPITYPELLRLVAHVLSRPGTRLATPTVWRPDEHTTGLSPDVAFQLSLGHSVATDLLGWVREMTKIGNELRKLRVPAGGDDILYAIGRVHCVWLHITITITGGLPLDIPASGCNLTVDELAALAKETAPVLTEQMAGAR